METPGKECVKSIQQRGLAGAVLCNNDGCFSRKLYRNIFIAVQPLYSEAFDRHFPCFFVHYVSYAAYMGIEIVSDLVVPLGPDSTYCPVKEGYGLRCLFRWHIFSPTSGPTKHKKLAAIEQTPSSRSIANHEDNSGKASISEAASLTT